LATNKEFKVTVSLDAETKDKLVAYCDDNDCSMSAVLRQALKAFLADKN